MNGRRLLGACCLGLLLTACASAPVELGRDPTPGRPLPASGLHVVKYAVVVDDLRELEDMRDLGKEASPLALGRRLRAARDPKLLVQDALVKQLRVHDLEVVAPDEANLILHLEVLRFMSWGEGRNVRALVEANVKVERADPKEELYWFSRRAEAAQHAGFLFRHDAQVAALDDALESLAGRIVRRPQFLIAAQRISSELKNKGARIFKDWDGPGSRPK